MRMTRTVKSPLNIQGAFLWCVTGKGNAGPPERRAAAAAYSADDFNSDMPSCTRRCSQRLGR